MNLHLRNGLYRILLAALSDPQVDVEAESRRLVREPADEPDRASRAARLLGALSTIRSLPPPRDPLDRDVRIAEALFRHGLYFDCHEYLESAWKQETGNKKTYLQGIIQAAAGLHKFELGFPMGGAGLLRNAANKIAACGLAEDVKLEKFAGTLLSIAEDMEAGKFRLGTVPETEFPY